MTITIIGQDLYNAVRHLAPIARSSLSSPDRRLRMRCIGKHLVEFAATGGAITARTYAKFDGSGFDDVHVVDSELLYKLSSRLKKADTAFEAKQGGELELRSGNVTTTFPKSDGPIVEDIEVCSVASVPTPVFVDAVKQALPYASSDDHRPALCGVYLDRVDGETHVTATNGATLFNRSFSPDQWPGELADGVILPDNLAKLALKLADAKGPEIQIRLGENHIVIAQEGVFDATTDRLDVTYPDFRQCIPRRAPSTPTATFDPTAMLDAVKAATPFVGKSEAVRVAYNGSVQVQVDSDGGRFDCDLHGEYDGRHATLTFNRKYLGEMCATLSGDGDVRQLVGGRVEPQLFWHEGDERTQVIVMPMRL